jgi:hypothetical protein
VLVDTRRADEAFAEDGPKGWGVRAAYAVVRCRMPCRFWLRPREVLVPVGKLWPSGRHLRADLDVTELWPRLFGLTAV